MRGKGIIAYGRAKTKQRKFRLTAVRDPTYFRAVLPDILAPATITAARELDLKSRALSGSHTGERFAFSGNGRAIQQARARGGLGAALDRVLSRFDSPRPEGKGYLVLCPAHDDHAPSLRIQQSDDGQKVLLTCRAGCTLEAILSAKGIEKRDLFESTWSSAKPNGSHDGIKGQGRPPFGKITASYDYHDDRGTLLYQVVRDEHKNFKQRRPSNLEPPAPMWIDNLDGVRRVLYRAVELSAARHYGHRIYIVEGEKDADNLAAMGLTATTAPQGAAAAWLPQYTDQLAGAAEVVILPDNDDPGKKHAEKVRDAIAEWVSCVKVLALPDLEGKQDVSDWLAIGGTKEKLEELATAAIPFVTPSQRFVAADFELGEFMARPYTEPPSILGNGLISAGDLVIFYGKPGLGKTWAILQQAIELSQGRGLYGLAPPAKGPLRVGILELEMHAGFFQKRLGWILEKSPDADLSRVRVISRPDLRGAVDMLTDDYKALAQWCKHQALDLVIIDALSRAHSTDENKAVEFGQVLRRFDEVSEETGTAIELVHHEPKSPSSGKELDDLDAVRGTSRMITDCKALIRLTQIKKDELFSLRFPKTNNAPPIAPIYLTRPEHSGFEVTDYSPEKRKAENVDKIRDAYFHAGLVGLTDREAAIKSGLSEKTVKRRREEIGTVRTSERVAQGDGQARKWVYRYRLADTDGQSGDCPSVSRETTSSDLDI